MTTRSSLVTGLFAASAALVAAPALADPSALSLRSGRASASGVTEAKGPFRKIDFNRDVLPILSDACFHCHGPDPKTRKAGLRLDEQKGAFEDLGGYRAIEPNQPAKSELFLRITTTDPDDVMPPPDSGKHRLTPEQIELVRQWIFQGASWQPHWAFQPPRRVTPAASRFDGWARNAIDRFVGARLEQAGLAPSPEASRRQLVRRLTLDLTGLPPTPGEVDAFERDGRPDAYERLVDRLLASPHYGEHQARFWLDAARYGDTHGLHFDNRRAIWPYRDFVVRAFNDNLPFDRFTTWQLAGDLLPSPTREQRVATGFIRCNMTTNEGGVIAEEAKAHLVRDRVEAIATTYLGLTMQCAACHDHKYDPVSQKDFYSFSAFFDNGKDAPLDGNIDAPEPFLRLGTPAQEKDLARLDGELSKVNAEIRAALDRAVYSDPMGEERAGWLAPVEHALIGGGQGVPAAGEAILESARWSVEGGALEVVTEGAGQVGWRRLGRVLEVGGGDRVVVYVTLAPEARPAALMVQLHDAGGSWSHRAYWGSDVLPYGKSEEGDAGRSGYLRVGDLPAAAPGRAGAVRLDVAAEAIGLRPGARIDGVAVAQHGGRASWHKVALASLVPPGGFTSLAHWERVERAAASKRDAKDPIRKALEKEPPARSEGERRLLRDHFLERVYPPTREALLPLHARQAALAEERRKLEEAIPQTLVYEERSVRGKSHVLVRGEYDHKGAEVQPDVPAVLPRLPAGVRPDRLALARWLLDPAHPLMARTTVNRLWQQHFGVGLVKTPFDLGVQGEWPAHRELLDWLALELSTGGWDVKRLHRLMVTSATYRQSSAVTRERLEKDPENRLLSRGPRFRLDAEVLRDQALAVSGLLVDKRGGAGVNPYQPEGLWLEVAFPTSNTKDFKADSGEALYRRTLYTFWKRTSPPPNMTTFDAPSREYCTVRRERTNTPLQALVLLNDPQFVEAARKLGERMVREGGATVEGRLSHGFRLVSGRRATADELAVLRTLFEKQRAAYEAAPAEAEALLAVGEAKASSLIPPAELAAYALVANALLNLDEAVTLQ
jgi:mono/diheme cytochrome c family protein